MQHTLSSWQLTHIEERRLSWTSRSRRFSVGLGRSRSRDQKLIGRRDGWWASRAEILSSVFPTPPSRDNTIKLRSPGIFLYRSIIFHVSLPYCWLWILTSRLLLTLLHKKCGLDKLMCAEGALSALRWQKSWEYEIGNALSIRAESLFFMFRRCNVLFCQTRLQRWPTSSFSLFPSFRSAATLSSVIWTFQQSIEPSVHLIAREQDSVHPECPGKALSPWSFPRLNALGTRTKRLCRS